MREYEVSAQDVSLYFTDIDWRRRLIRKARMRLVFQVGRDPAVMSDPKGMGYSIAAT